MPKLQIHRRRPFRACLRGEEWPRLKPNILFNMFVGKLRNAMLYSCTAALKLSRSTEIRFSVPSSCACKF